MSKNKTLFDLINDLDTAAQVPAWRSVAHSMMAKTIGAIRQDIRNSQYLTRNEDLPVSTDQRNEQDGLEKRDPPYGLENTAVDPILQASQYHALYDWASTELQTKVTTQWDLPMSPEEMIDYMIKRAVPTDMAFLEALANAAGTDVETMKQFQEAQERQEREQLIEQKPDILLTFHGFAENGYEDCDKAIDVISQHQLGVKVLEGLVKAKNKVLNRALQRRNLNDLGTIPIIDEGIEKVRAWIDLFEKEHRSEIGEAIEAGRNIRTAADVA